MTNNSDIVKIANTIKTYSAYHATQELLCMEATDHRKNEAIKIFLKVSVIALYGTLISLALHEQLILMLNRRDSNMLSHVRQMINAAPKKGLFS